MHLKAILLGAAILAAVAYGCIDSNCHSEKTVTADGVPIVIIAEKIKISAEDAMWYKLAAGSTAIKLTVTAATEAKKDSCFITVIDCDEQPNAQGIGIVQGPIEPGFEAKTILAPEGTARISLLRCSNDLAKEIATVNLANCRTE